MCFARCCSPVEVDGDGNCLVHSASVGLTGTQRYFDALRFAIYKVTIEERFSGMHM